MKPNGFQAFKTELLVFIKTFSSSLVWLTALLIKHYKVNPNSFLPPQTFYSVHLNFSSFCFPLSILTMGEGNGTPLQYPCLEIPWTEEPGGLQSMGSQWVGHDWAASLSLFTFMHWRRQWQPTPVFLPGESQGRGSLVGCRLWDRTDSDTTEATEATQQQQQQSSLLLP